MGKLLLLTGLVLAAGVALYFSCGKCNSKPADYSSFRADGWFGKKSLKAGEAIPKDSTDIRPFKVNISDADLNDLNTRLAKSRFVDHIEGTQFNYGFRSTYLKQVVEYWRTKYDWRKEEAKLNSYPQFKTTIEGIDIHFVHIKPTKPAKTVIPLLTIHGWPGSFLEYYKSFPLLIEPDQNGVAFEVIAPSIPGYGYSEAAHQKGFGVNAAARVFTKLMKRLGHEKFVSHGGDWGSAITRTIAVLYPENVIAVHMLGNLDGLNGLEKPCYLAKVLFASYFPSLFFSAETRESEYNKLLPLSSTFSFLLSEMGYLHIQATKPDTVGAALVDSPVGLAAYLLEKFSTWTNREYRNREDGGLTERFTLDELLTNVMIYWTSGNIAASQRFYKETLSASRELASAKVFVPVGTVDTPHELVRTPRKLVGDNYANFIQYSEIPEGGHFTAFEVPQLVSKDIRDFVHKVIAQQEEAKREQAKKVKDEV